jgi:hypothetical protein
MKGPEFGAERAICFGYKKVTKKKHTLGVKYCILEQ